MHQKNCSQYNVQSHQGLINDTNLKKFGQFQIVCGTLFFQYNANLIWFDMYSIVFKYNLIWYLYNLIYL